MDLFCYLCFVFVFVIMSCLFLTALRSPAGKGLTPFDVFMCFFYFSIIWCPRAGVSIPDLCISPYLAYNEWRQREWLLRLYESIYFLLFAKIKSCFFSRCKLWLKIDISTSVNALWWVSGFLFLVITLLYLTTNNSSFMVLHFTIIWCYNHYVIMIENVKIKWYKMT